MPDDGHLRRENELLPMPGSAFCPIVAAKQQRAVTKKTIQRRKFSISDTLPSR
jgi:hypothetical protein